MVVSRVLAAQVLDSSASQQLQARNEQHHEESSFIIPKNATQLCNGSRGGFSKEEEWHSGL